MIGWGWVLAAVWIAFLLGCFVGAWWIVTQDLNDRAYPPVDEQQRERMQGDPCSTLYHRPRLFLHK